MKARLAVFEQYLRWASWPSPPTGEVTFWHDTDGMADEIVRLRKQLAGVTVTEAMVKRAVAVHNGADLYSDEDRMRFALKAALTAASERHEEG